jgi:hypothetical protein
MFIQPFDKAGLPRAKPLAVSIVMPCLNEAISLPHCIVNARDALDRIEQEFGITGEIIIADNGSTDGSQAIATARGARVVAIAERGYGAAIIGGGQAAFGDYLLIGDADGSYDFTDGVAMIGRLIAGADLCIGSRFSGNIAPGAMPWKNRYIGNPLLTGLLNSLFKTKIDDAHCGLRAIDRESFLALRLNGTGMEFASEMVVKAGLRGLRIAQAPVTLSRDLRDRPPHLRPWRDGWRHLRYMLMLSPTWLFGAPGVGAIMGASVVLLVALVHQLGLFTGSGPFGPSWTLVAGFLLCLGHLSCIMAAASYLHGVGQGYRPMRPSLHRYSNFLTLESMLMTGTALIGLSLFGLAGAGLAWSQDGFAPPSSTLPVLLASVSGALGLQTIIGGFVLSIVGGHEARFLADRSGTIGIPAIPVSARPGAEIVGIS